jgi:hypothetical protein
MDGLIKRLIGNQRRVHVSAGAGPKSPGELK